MSVVRILIDICLLRKGPQHLPASLAVTATSLLAYLATGAHAQSLAAPETPALPVVILNVAALVLLVLLLLYLHGFLPRAHQTISALAGTGTLFTIAGLPVLHGLLWEHSGPALQALVVAGWLALVVWSFIVTGHVLRHALSISFSMGLLYAMALLAASILIYGLTLGPRA